MFAAMSYDHILAGSMRAWDVETVISQEAESLARAKRQACTLAFQVKEISIIAGFLGVLVNLPELSSLDPVDKVVLAETVR
jgi:hypothetical protein